MEDEAKLGNGPMFGGALTLPFSKHWAFDLDVTRARAEREMNSLRFGGNRTLISPALQYRRGGQRFYSFAAFGIGVVAADIWHEREGLRSSGEDVGPTLHMRAGLVAAMTERWLFRADVFLAHRYVVPDVGIRAGIGYRF